ncbi:MAG: hypothetical protein MUC36_09200 [Planctomycetes bacterium]|nr:hypothetical protein [Planctomycetota bacterium]
MHRPLHPALLWPLSLLVGIALFLLTNLVEPAVPATLNFGTDFAAMSRNLDGYIGSFPHRILSPLLGRGVDEIAHWFGGSIPYWQFAHGCNMVFVAVLFAAANLLGARPWQALLLTATIAFTGAVQLYKGHVGYAEPVTFTLLLGSVLAARRPVLFWSLNLLNVLHHEQILFFWPWLVWWRQQHGARWWHDLLGAALVLGCYAAWRHHVGLHAQQQMLTFRHYLELTRQYFPVGTLGLSALNAMCMLVYFGALPALVVWHAGIQGLRRGVLPLLLFLLCQHAMFGVAHDVYRFTCFLFLPVLLAGVRLLQQPRGALPLAGLGLVSGGAVYLQRPVFAEVGAKVLTDVDANGVPFVRPDIVGDIVPKVIPALPWTFAAYGAALVACVVIGLLWARWTRARSAARTASAT